MAKKPIYVTQPHLPPLHEFIPYLERIWESRILTNAGPMHQQFESSLCRHLGVEHVALFANGTLALLTALQALQIRGEVITTPYSFVATAHTLLWNGLSPVFVDIDRDTLNINPKLIESAITSRTAAILPVHCYGHPCDVDAIKAIAHKHGLKVIYDAAHAFGVRDSGGSILRHGDLSAISFHATKVFNTFEGGAIVCPNAEMKLHINHLKNFGFVDETTVVEAGINAKMSEINAALGLLQLQYVDAAIARRKQIDERYRTGLDNIAGIRAPRPGDDKHHNHAYFPILVGRDCRWGRDQLYHALKRREVHARRYFYPLISNFPMYRDLPSAAESNLPVANEMADQVLCLPIYPGMADNDVDRVIDCIMDDKP